MTASVEYLARLTCACGRTAETSIYIDSGPCSSDRCKPELDFFHVDGWLGGFDDAHPLECPTCVELRR